VADGSRLGHLYAPEPRLCGAGWQPAADCQSACFGLRANSRQADRGRPLGGAAGCQPAPQHTAWYSC